MKYFILKNKDGKYLNTNYQRWPRDNWQNEPRLYKSAGGIRAVMGRIVWPSIQRKLGPFPSWDGMSRPYLGAERLAYFAAISKIKTPDYFALLAEDGFELIEKEVTL